mgnify:FL=1
MSLKEWKNDEINTKLMKKWGFLKENKSKELEHPPEGPGDPGYKERLPKDSPEEELYEGGPGDEHYQFDKKERDDELEEECGDVAYREDDKFEEGLGDEIAGAVKELTAADWAKAFPEAWQELKKMGSGMIDLIKAAREQGPRTEPMGDEEKAEKKAQMGALGDALKLENRSGKISVKEAKQITRRIIERVKLENK